MGQEFSAAGLNEETGVGDPRHGGRQLRIAHSTGSQEEVSPGMAVDWCWHSPSYLMYHT